MFKINKNNPVVSLIDYLNRFSTDIKRTNTKNRIEKIKLENELMDLEIENFKKEMERDEKQAKRDYFQSIKKVTLGLKVLHLLACIGSLILTPLGFGLIDEIVVGYNKIFEKGNTNDEIISNFVLSILLTAIITVIQLKGFYYAAMYNQIDQYFHKHAWLAKLITLIIVPVSIAGNFNELYDVVKFTSIMIVNVVILLFVCMALDFSIILGFKLKHDKKYKNYHRKHDLEQESDELTLWNMIKTYTIDYLKMRMIDSFYEKRESINEKFRKYNPKEELVNQLTVEQIKSKNENIIAFPVKNSHEKTHEINDLESHDILEKTHENSHEKLEETFDKNSLDSHEKSDSETTEKTNENSHEKISLENQDVIVGITSLEQYEKNKKIQQNSINKTHEKIEANSDENNLEFHEISHENNDKNFDRNVAKSHENTHEKNELDSNENKTNSHEKSHEKNEKSNRKKTTSSKKNNADKILEYINKNYKSGEKINVGELKSNLKLKDYDWTANRKKLMEDNKLTVNGSDTYSN